MIDCAWDKAGYIRDGTEDLRERVGKGRGGLNGGKVDFSNVISGGIRQHPSTVRGWCFRSRVVEPEGSFCLRDGNLTGDLGDILVEFSPDVVVVAEDESLLQLETDGDNISSVLFGKSVGLIDF